MRLGEVVGDRFEILQRAGAGGMGVVHQAWDLHTGRAVALKVLHERGEDLTDRFMQEVELLSALEHPRIVGYVSHGVTAGGAPYLVMPWLDGEDLQRRLDRGQLSVDESIALGRATAEGLAYLHGRGLVHRDLKPSNIFLPSGRVEDVKIIDLGIARTTIPKRAMTISGVLLGTPGFMAPEQARGEFEVTPAADVFSLGCVLFECLTGRRLFEGTHVMAILAKILLQIPPRVRELRADVPNGLDALVHRMVAKDPLRRPRDGAELVELLSEVHRPSPAMHESVPLLSLTEAERRVVPVLVVVLAHPADSSAPSAPAPAAEATLAEGDPFRASAARFGVRSHALDGRTAIVLARDGLSAMDQACLLARYARYLAETFAGATLALATGNTITGGNVPMGEAIDRSVTIVRSVSPGFVHVDDVSAALITSRFDVRRDDKLLVLADERRSLDPTRPLIGRPTSCVGRDREFAILDATYTECIDSAMPKVVLVTASAGVGKSRLRHEFMRRLRVSARPKILQCRGDPLQMATPYAQIAQAIRQAADLREDEEPDRARARLTAYAASLLPSSEVARVAAFLGELVEVAFEDDGLVSLRAARHSAEAMVDQVRLAFEDVMRAQCKLAPMLLVLEDLHWGDADTIRLIDAALRKLEGVPLFVLALARPELHERFSALWANRDLTEIRLPPLSPAACARLVREVLGEETADARVDAIVSRSEGNAFHLEELIRSADRASLRPFAGADVPETVIAVAQARLERLDTSERRVLRAASIFGERFGLAGVSALVGEDASIVEPLVASLVEQEAVAPADAPGETSSSAFVFRHVLLRSAAYATLTAEDRALGHRLAAQWLESEGGDRETAALHWLEGAEQNRAAAAFTHAARVRRSHAQANAAARCALRALLVADPNLTSPDDVCSRVDLLADAFEVTRGADLWEVTSEVTIGASGQPSSAGATKGVAARVIVKEAIARSIETCRERAPRRLAVSTFARAATAIGALSDFDAARSLLKDAQLLASEDGESILRVRSTLAKIAFWSGDWGEAADCLSTLPLPSDPKERASSLLILATAIVCVEGRDALGRALQYISRAEALGAVSPDDPLAELRCSKAQSICFYFAGELANAVSSTLATIDLARRAGFRYEQCIHLHNLAEARLRLDDAGGALAPLLESNAIARDIGADHMHLQNEVLLAFIGRQVARLEGLADDFRAAGNSWRELRARYWLGRLFAARDERQARAAFLRALDLAVAHRVRSITEECGRMLAELAPEE